MKTSIGRIALGFTLYFAFTWPSFGQNVRPNSERTVIFPIGFYSGDMGLGLGVDLSWLNIRDSSWSLHGFGFYTTAYQQSFLGTQLTNRKLANIFYVSLGGGYAYSSRSLFYGFGPNSLLFDPAQYTQLSQKLDGKFGLNIFENFVIGALATYNKTEIGDGNREDSTQFLSRYESSAPYPRGAISRSLGAFMLYNSQEPEFAPQSGTNAMASYEASISNASDEPKYQRIQAKAVHVQPIVEEELLVVGRVQHERLWGDAPFYSQARLGGMHTLRSYKGGRFTDMSSILYGVEPRWVFWRPESSFTRVELSGGIEAGRVYNTGTAATWYDQLNTSYVVGLTGILKPGIPLRMDWASGIEGNQFYLHLFYPF